MTTSKLTVDEGTTTPLATYQVFEDAENKQLSRTVLNDENGTEVGTVADPLQVAAASLPLPTGAATAANQQTDALTDAELRATPVPVSGTVTATPSGTQAVSVADGSDVALGTTSDADTALTVIGRLKKLVSLLAGGLPAALGAGGGVKVDGSGTALPVSGTVTATGPLTDTQLRATPVPVSGAVTTSGTVTEANSAAIAASLSVMDDWDESDRAKVNPIAGQVGVQGGSGTVTALTQRVVAATDVATPKLSASGRLFDTTDSATVTVKTANGVATASGDNVVLAAVTGKKIRVLSYGLQVQEAGTIVTARFQDNGTATNRTMPWKLFMAADGTNIQGVVRNPGGDAHFYFETGEGVGLDLNLDGAIDVGWELTYVECE